MCEEQRRGKLGHEMNVEYAEAHVLVNSRKAFPSKRLFSILAKTSKQKHNQQSKVAVSNSNINNTYLLAKE